MSLKERLGLESSPVFLVDGHAFIYRFYYAFRDMQRSDGFPTNAVFMFLRMLLNILKNEKPEYMGVFFDGKGPTFRHELFEPYKAQRPKMPEDLAMQLDPAHEVVKLLGMHMTISDGVEADDCMAAVADHLKGQHPVVIVGADKDLKQCLDERVYLWDPGSRKEKLTSLEDFRKETGLEPDQWADFQALIGDSADNIPGVPGVGPKTAVKIMAQYPTLEELRDAVNAGEGDFKPAMRKKLEANMEDAFLFRKLTRLSTDVCQEITLDSMAVIPPNFHDVAAFLKEYEFRTLLRDLEHFIPRPAEPAPAEAPAASAQGAAGTEAPAKATAGKTAKKSGAEQLSLFGMGGISAPVAPAEEIVRSAATPRALPDCAGTPVGLLPLEEGWQLGINGQEWKSSGSLDELLEKLSVASEIVTPSVKALLRADSRWSTVPLERWCDLGLAAYLLSPEDRDYSWDRLNLRLAPEVLEAEVVGEACRAAALGQGLKKRLEAAHLTALLRDLEMPLIPVLADMEKQGICIDAKTLAEFLSEVSAELEGYTTRIREQAGKDFNLRSSQQMAEVLFTDLGLKPRGKTPGGSPSTSFDVLEKIRKEHPIIEDIQSWRKLEKMRSTYLEPLPRAADANGRVHTSFNQLATATGRLSSSGPNLQNIPIRGDMGKRMRGCFTAGEGKSLVAADYSQIELRVLAHFSQEPALVDAFRKGEDIHSRTAALLFDVAPDQIEPDQRRNAKTINFGLIYGMGPQKLGRELGITVKEAKAFIERYFERLSGLADFYDSVEQDARRDGHVLTLAGRRRMLPDINSRNSHHQSTARRQAINTRIQGSAADIIKMAMLSVHRDELLQELDARMILQVHDELLLEAAPENAAQAGQRLEEIMTGIYDLSVPLVVDWGIGENWGEAH